MDRRHVWRSTSTNPPRSSSGLRDYCPHRLVPRHKTALCFHQWSYKCLYFLFVENALLSLLSALPWGLFWNPKGKSVRSFSLLQGEFFHWERMMRRREAVKKGQGGRVLTRQIATSLQQKTEKRWAPITKSKAQGYCQKYQLGLNRCKEAVKATHCFICVASAWQYVFNRVQPAKLETNQIKAIRNLYSYRAAVTHTKKRGGASFLLRDWIPIVRWKCYVTDLSTSCWPLTIPCHAIIFRTQVYEQINIIHV